MELKINQQVKGTRIISGSEAKQQREVVRILMDLANASGFEEIILPSVEKSEIYTDKAGKEVLNQMYTFKDKGDRDLCLRPEVTATVQLIANKYYQHQKDVKFWYYERCWRYEKPQKGRYREFFQFGVEWINPRDIEAARREIIELSREMISEFTPNYEVNNGAKRGLDYYIGNGFEISAPDLGAQKQVVGGGTYKEGIGFAIGVERLALLLDKK